MYWKSNQIQLLHLILRTAGYEDYQLLYEAQAISLQYGYYHELHWNDSYSNTVLFVDIGYSHTTAFTTVFREHSLRVTTCESSTECCGRQVDESLLQMVYKKLQNEGVDVTKESQRWRADVAAQCEACKKLFTPDGLDRCELRIQCEDEDCVILITRDEFKNCCNTIVDAILKLCNTCLEKSPETSVVLLEGSTARLVFIRDVIQDLLSKRSPPVVMK